MKISFVSENAVNNGTVIIPVFIDEDLHSGAKVYTDVIEDIYTRARKASRFEGKYKKSFSIYGPQGLSVSRLLFIGAGKRDAFDPEIFGASLARAEMFSGDKDLTFALAGLKLSADDCARIVVGLRLGTYRFDNYRTKLSESKKPSFKTVQISTDNVEGCSAAYHKFHGPACDGQIIARDLVSEPPNKLFPKSYADRIKGFEPTGLKVEVLGEKEMSKLGMHALLGVGLGSERESQLVIMHWNGGKKDEKPVCLVGKGVTFDTGGISLKPGNNMWDMKGDMGGSAAVVGTMHALASRKAKANVIGIVGLVENMPDGKAQLPGDVITSMSGQTIEVQNTDAEGRLVLADALHYAVTNYNPKFMINLATLTGAIISALGHEHAGLFTNSDELAKQITDASETTSELTWRLPLSKHYDRLLNSPNADMKNIGGSTAGSITAAQFLKRFVGDTPWAHLDIAGTGMKNTRHDPREPAFATGFGVRLLNRWVADNFEG